jgi:hypothetical protein
MRVLLVAILMIPIGIFSSQFKHAQNAPQDTHTDAGQTNSGPSVGQTTTSEECKRQCNEQAGNSHSGAVLWGFTRSDLIALALAIITLIYVGVNYEILQQIKKQAHFMKRQLAEMQNSRRETVAEMRSSGEQTKDTLKHLETQVGHLGTLAEAAKESAAAATLTAQRLAQIEGARITVTLGWNTLIGTIDYSEEGLLLHLALTCKNEGRSAGWVSRIRLEAGLFRNTIPSGPDFEHAKVMWNGLDKISMGEEIKQLDSYPLQAKRDSFSDWIVIWGRVEYIDTFSDKRETTFGYILSPDDRTFDPIQMPVYNKRT